LVGLQLQETGPAESSFYASPRTESFHPNKVPTRSGKPSSITLLSRIRKYFGEFRPAEVAAAC